MNELILSALLMLQLPSSHHDLEFKVTSAVEPIGVEDYVGIDVGVRQIPNSIEEYKALVCEIRNVPLIGPSVRRAKPADYRNIRISLHLGLQPTRLEQAFPPQEQTLRLGFYVQNDPKKGTISIFWLKGRHLAYPEDYSFHPDAGCEPAGKMPEEE